MDSIVNLIYGAVMLLVLLTAVVFLSLLFFHVWWVLPVGVLAIFGIAFAEASQRASVRRDRGSARTAWSDFARAISELGG